METEMELRIQKLRDTFSYTEPCVRSWETHRPLRQLGIKGDCLVKGEDTNGVIPPSLANIKRNYHLLKGYTQHMASTGVIITKLIRFLMPPVASFYELMELDVNTIEAKSLIYATAYLIKKMLHVIRRKWARWEMPRVAKLQGQNFASMLCIHACCKCGLSFWMFFFTLG